MPGPDGETELELVDDHDIGIGAIEQREQGVPVADGADRHDPGRLAEDRLHAGPQRGVGIEDRDADHAGTRTGRRTCGR